MAWEDMANNVMGACTNAFKTKVPITHRPAAGDDQEFKGIWSDVYLSAEPETGIQIMTSDPNIGARLKDFDVAPKKHDIFIKDEVQYRARALEPDGEAGVVIVLEKVAS